jgi:hypothetical protein
MTSKFKSIADPQHLPKLLLFCCCRSASSSTEDKELRLLDENLNCVGGEGMLQLHIRQQELLLAEFVGCNYKAHNPNVMGGGGEVLKVATLKYRTCTVLKGRKGCATLHYRVEPWEGKGRLRLTCSVSEFKNLEVGTCAVS